MPEHSPRHVREFDHWEREPWGPEQGTPQPLIEYSAAVLRDHTGRHDGYARVIVRAGPRGSKHIVPPAGEEYAFDSPEWARRVEIVVSPTGRSVRVFVDGQEIPPHTPTTENPT